MKAKVIKRFTDLSKHTFSQWGILIAAQYEILVCCPKCGQEAILRKTAKGYQLCCKSCYHTELRTCSLPKKSAKGCCKSCGRWFNLSLPQSMASYAQVSIRCPCCKMSQTVQAQQTGSYAKDPLYGLSLYLETSFRGQSVWAYNREHLAYLIAYIGADLREKPFQQNLQYYMMQGQSDLLPKFMKQAKNRRGLLKALKKLQYQ